METQGNGKKKYEGITEKISLSLKFNQPEVDNYFCSKLSQLIDNHYTCIGFGNKLNARFLVLSGTVFFIFLLPILT